MKAKILVFFLFLSYFFGYAQTQNFEDCDTEDLDTAVFKRLPWFDNNHLR